VLVLLGSGEPRIDSLLVSLFATSANMPSNGAVFLSRERGALVRCTPLTSRPTARWRISIDASPWGSAGILYDHNDFPTAYFADRISPHVLFRCGATLGDSAYTTLLEALALLVALRIARGSSATVVAFQMWSDSLGTLSSVLKASSQSPSLNNSVSEILLDEAELYSSIALTVRVPGLSNIQPDALSRLYAPTPSRPPPVSAYSPSLPSAQNPGVLADPLPSPSN
jgi:hypothetical protein